MPAQAYRDVDYKNLQALSRRYGVDLWSYHLPFMPFEELDPSALDETVRCHTVAYFTELMQKGADIGIDKFVIHASGEPLADVERAARLQCAMQSLDTLAEVAHAHGAVLAVEDLPRSCLGNTGAEIETLLSANDKLRVCLDTNHLLSEDVGGCIRRLADKIVTVHISDYDFINERHWLPGEGKLDWKAIYEAFEEVGYDGVWMYEIVLECPKTILRDRALTFRDFYDNATALFRKETPRVFSRPKENLGMWE